MSRRWIVDASPLILLGKIDRIDLLRDLADELIIPRGVALEVRVKPAGERLIERVLEASNARLEASDTIPREIAVWDLGRGESEVLALSLIFEGSRAVVDDLEARRCAQALGIGVVGTLGVVLRAKRLGLIPQARPVLTALRQVGLYASEELIEKALDHLGE